MAADALSRKPHTSPAELLALSTAQPVWLQELQNSYDQSPHAKQLLVELAIQPSQGHFALDQGIIRYKGKIWLGHDDQLQQNVMKALHSSPIGGHSVSLVTYYRIKKLFSWPRMQQNI